MYEPHELDDGSVLQSGIPSPDVDAPPPSSRFTFGMVVRGIVLQTYYADDEGWADQLWSGARGVFCDVRVFGKRSRVLTRVPVCQGAGGVFDEDTYVPRAAALNLDGGALVSDGSQTTAPTMAQSMDGDSVLVGFLENDPFQPFVFPFALPHPAQKHDYAEADGRVRRIRHNGVLLEWDAEGNLLIDATGSAKPDLGAGGVEVSNSGTAGKITIKTADATGAVSKVELDQLGAARVESAAITKLELLKDAEATLAAATKAVVDAPLVELSTAPLEPTIKGVTYNTAESALLVLISQALVKSAAAFTALAAIPLLSPAATPLADATKDLGLAVGGIVAFTGAAASWTSTKVKAG